MPTEQLINELQSFGVRLADPNLANPKAGGDSRRGGAGPSDHMPMTINGATVMIPVHNAPAFESPYLVDRPDAQGRSRVSRDGHVIGEVRFQLRPRFYERSTADGIPYSQIATLHGRDVLATTILQTCIRYQSRTKTCRMVVASTSRPCSVAIWE
jgi:biotin synthase-related radical SAM superfamily protein